MFFPWGKRKSLSQPGGSDGCLPGKEAAGRREEPPSGLLDHFSNLGDPGGACLCSLYIWVTFLGGTSHWDVLPQWQFQPTEKSRRAHDTEETHWGSSLPPHPGSIFSDFSSSSVTKMMQNEIPRISNYLCVSQKPACLLFPHIHPTSSSFSFLLSSVVVRTFQRCGMFHELVYLRGGPFYFLQRKWRSTLPESCYKGTNHNSADTILGTIFHVSNTFEQNAVKWNTYFFQVAIATATGKGSSVYGLILS